MEYQELELPEHIRYAIYITTVFVTWVTLESWFNPVQRHMWMDAELLNATGAYTIPACFIVTLYFVLRYYVRKATRDTSRKIN